jgi:hypothetical protein
MNEWISVEDRLPEEKRRYVLGYMPEFPGGIKCSQTVFREHELWPYVTHWMPLPEPPK